ncbi:hypothetical protein Vretimale_6128 [Volvox reticuliferus]|uniref:O-fucosyltransferase family protein n=1 Tax=Volvox reticuliferus TaxID=1737510 RepID=A0A8J4G6W7_9CHLO|nr:hypothetical protein Vretifemale_7951 [Volvox reticuliferus]GIM01322.1 hypothetical protein Vretimale_6128 [Volvox reticuliferus]
MEPSRRAALVKTSDGSAVRVSSDLDRYSIQWLSAPFYPSANLPFSALLLISVRPSLCVYVCICICKCMCVWVCVCVCCRKGLAPLVRIISREDAVRQYGWSQSGRADVLLSISPTSGLESTLEKAHQAELLDVRGAHVVRNHGFSCSTEGLSWLSRAAAGHRWIALYSYRRVVPAARSSYRVFRGDDSPCARAYHQVSLRLEKSPLITSTARNFVITALAHMQDGEGQGRPITEESTGGGGGGRITNSFPYYIALHVRPYPDTCLEYFVNMTTFDIDTASKVCTNPRLLLRMVPLVRQLLEARAAAAAAAAAATGTVWSPNGTWVLSSPSGSTLRAADAGARPPGADGAVFVMSHPRVREVLRRELRRLWDEADGASGRGGNGSSSPLPSPPPLASSPPPSLLRAPPLFFLDMSDLPVQLRTHVASTSLLSMVEQQMCLEAAVFIGTKVSSISVLVAQERSAKGEEGAVATAAHRAVEEARRGGDEEGRRGRGADDRGDGVDEGHPSVGQPGQGQDRADVGAEHLFFGVDTVLL